MDRFQHQQLFTSSQAADILGVSRITVFRWIKEGAIHATKVGRNYLISGEEILKHAAPLTTSSKAEIEKLVARTIKDYGETIRMLGGE